MTPQSLVALLVAAGITRISIGDVAILARELREWRTDREIDVLLGIEVKA
jgi:hypothetical protein